jgi:hypothetical protein
LVGESSLVFWLGNKTVVLILIIVFAMAPLGIITALVSAIRVGGPTWLKALVGRARENVAQVEVELMSSTSEDVCEIYNGKTLIRTMGRPLIKQLVYLDSLREGKEFGLFSLDHAGGFPFGADAFSAATFPAAHKAVSDEELAKSRSVRPKALE